MSIFAPVPDDPNSEEHDLLGISKLTESFLALTGAIDTRIEALVNETQDSINSQTEAYTEGEIAQCDEALEAMRRIIKQCDQIEQEFDKIAIIGEIAKDFQARLAQAEKSLVELSQVQ
ncbi:hypothetical protein CJU90_6770 [Yarrowia sp. C11]|nr:hypothetical protein CJU90_6770 [Yarrowia sp. C11]KAG5359434.1 hypothetical protein CKK34_5785 [Yarrowia sp. E02]